MLSTPQSLSDKGFSLSAIPFVTSSEIYFQRLNGLANKVWLDSGKPRSNYGRFDILSAEPLEILTNCDTADIENKVNDLIGTDLKDCSQLTDFPFLGGAIGFFNYHQADNNGQTQEKQHSNNQVPNKQTKTNQENYNAFGIFDWAVIQDHKLSQAYILFLPSVSEARKQRLTSTLLSEQAKEEATATGNSDSNSVNNLSFSVNNLKADISKSDYKNAFEKIQDYILAGDTYQVNYAQRFSGDFEGSPETAYLTLRKHLPSPFSGYFELTDSPILSFSPERFIEVNNRSALTSPIKGTMPRGKTLEEDEALALALLNSEKNQAENLMIVDLLRNDFNKSCEPHSVKTLKLFALESFANVHHLVSSVSGVVKNNIPVLQFFKDCFPGGSITGAPKKRAMEIIEELEAHPRQIYCGSMLYLSCHGRLDSNITIRTLLIENDKIYCWGGGGIVGDSDKDGEYEESINKVNILLKTLKGC